MSEKKEEENRMEEIINKKEDENDLVEITIIYNFNKSREIEIDEIWKERIYKELRETISKEKIIWRKIY